MLRSFISVLGGGIAVAREAHAGQDAVDDARVVDVVGRVAHADLIARFDRHEQRLGVGVDARREPISSTPACVNSRMRPSCGCS